jgi:hypothetical protein
MKKKLKCFAKAGIMALWVSSAWSYEIEPLLTAPKDSDGIYSQSYPWAMALGPKNVWIGTGANVLCGGANPGRKVSLNAFMPSRETSVIRCDKTSMIPGAPYDWRPPALWTIDRQTHQSRKISVDTSTLLGFRSAGVIGHTALMISEGVTGSADFGKIVVMMFDDQNGHLIRSVRLGPGGQTGFSMPRNGATFGNRYYFPYQNKADGLVMHVASVDEKGNFQSVGSFPARGGVVTTYKDRLVFGAWGDRKTIARIYVSSPYPFSTWKPFFSFDQYEPDVGAALTYDTGAMQEHHGWLYFGTINGPLLAMGNEIKSMGPIPNPVNAIGGERSVAVFRARDIETDQPVIENLYGRKAYPAHVSPVPSSLPLRPGLWVVKKTGMAPKCGPAGFGNPDNRYIWSMASMGDRVYVGTMDMTTTLLSSAIDLVEKIGSTRVAGGDLYALRGDDGCDEAITRNGFGDPFVYGFRNLLASPEGLYIGGANPFNKKGGFVVWLLKDNPKPEDLH